MRERFEGLLQGARRRRWVHVGVVVLRIFLAFAFVPAGLKKVLQQPFTDPSNTGPFHEFLHAFYATGAFYQFVGVVQLVAAFLLLSQRFATLGAILFTPILTVILVFCWSTKVYPTAVVVTLMFLATLGLVLWDYPKWRGALLPDPREHELRIAPQPPLVDLNLWAACGLTVTGLYLAVCALTGTIYRPMGAELDRPEFYVFPLMLLLVAITLGVDEARYRRSPRAPV